MALQCGAKRSPVVHSQARHGRLGKARYSWVERGYVRQGLAGLVHNPPS